MTDGNVMRFPTKYTTEDEEFGNPSEWNIPGSDSKGHSERIWARISPAQKREIEIVFHSGQFPYKTPADLLRHSLVRHLKWLRSIGGPVTTFSQQIELVNNILHDVGIQEDVENAFERLDYQVQRLMDKGKSEDAIDILNTTLQAIEEGPDGKYKERYLEEFYKKYGHLV